MLLECSNVLMKLNRNSSFQFQKHFVVQPREGMFSLSIQLFFSRVCTKIDTNDTILTTSRFNNIFVLFFILDWMWQLVRKYHHCKTFLVTLNSPTEAGMLRQDCPCLSWSHFALKILFGSQRQFTQHNHTRFIALGYF